MKFIPTCKHCGISSCNHYLVSGILKKIGGRVVCKYQIRCIACNRIGTVSCGD